MNTSLARLLFESSSNTKPKILLLQGPLGAGKTFFVKEILKKTNVGFVNLDEKLEDLINSDEDLRSKGITAQNAFSGRQPPDVDATLKRYRDDSRKHAKGLQRGFESERRSFVIEGTGQRRYRDEIEFCKANGYELLYLSVYAPKELSLDTTRKRGESGGRMFSSYLIGNTLDGYLEHYSELKQWFLNESVCTYYETTSLLEVSEENGEKLLRYPASLGLGDKSIPASSLSYQERKVVDSIRKSREQIRSELEGLF